MHRSDPNHFLSLSSSAWCSPNKAMKRTLVSRIGNARRADWSSALHPAILHPVSYRSSFRTYFMLSLPPLQILDSSRTPLFLGSSYVNFRIFNCYIRTASFATVPQSFQHKMPDIEMTRLPDHEHKKETKSTGAPDDTEYRPINWKRILFSPKYIRMSSACALRVVVANCQTR